jgi:hypothetical protein
VVKMVEEKIPNFTIRDLLPEDLLVHPAEKKVTSATDPKMDLSAFLANGIHGADIAKVSPVGPDGVTILPKPTPKRIRRKYFPEPDQGSQIQGNTETDIQETSNVTSGLTASESIFLERNSSQSQEKSLKYTPPHKLRPTAVATPFFRDDFPPLPPTKPLPPTPSVNKKSNGRAKNGAHISPVLDQSIAETSHEVEMDIAVGQRDTIAHSMKTKVSSIDHLPDTFADKTWMDYSEKEPEKLLPKSTKNGHVGLVHCQADEIHSSVNTGLDMQEYV